LDNDRFEWEVVVPANTTATIYVFARERSKVTEGGQLVESANGVAFLRMDNGCAVFQLVSGTYHFSSRLE
jgi:alpha-L-rhamnosidase